MTGGKSSFYQRFQPYHLPPTTYHLLYQQFQPYHLSPITYHLLYTNPGRRLVLAKTASTIGPMGIGKSILRIFCAIVLVVLLTACGGAVGGPNRQLVEKAIELELGQTQQILSKQLRLDFEPESITVKRVKITNQAPLEIDNLQGYRITGNYDYTVKLPTRKVTQTQNPFEVYLQRQKEGKTWKLAKPQVSDEGESIWVTQRISY